MKTSRFDKGADAAYKMQRRLPQPIIIVQGGQWGSEAKGAITAALVAERNVDFVVRTGAVNAGHTFYHGGVEYKMQQIPCGFHRREARLVIGAGAMINPEIFNREIEMIHQFTGEDIRGRLLVDYRAGLHLDEHQDRAKLANRHHKMGATGKGCSEAVTAKIRERGSEHVLLFKDWLEGNAGRGRSNYLLPFASNVHFVDTEKLLNDAYDAGLQILLEATQGTLLDLHLGPYPYTTHKQSIAGQWPTECGLSPRLQYEIALVCRTYPIRVAGNSGPMPGEISWVSLARGINRKLGHRNLPPMVTESALVEFEQACREIGHEKYGLSDVAFHLWSAEERKLSAVAVSELHRDALLSVGARTQVELRKLFEMTTVTKKLRRIAECDTDAMRTSIRQNRPSYVVLTFLNYKFPQYWNETNPEVLLADREVWAYINLVETAWGCNVRYVTTGPLSSHVHDIEPYKGELCTGGISR